MTPRRRETAGWALGVAAMAMFGLTLPMTQLATGSAAAPQLSPAFVTCGRGVVAAALSALFLLLTRSPRPARGHWPLLALAALGNALGYPLLLAWALREVSTQHVAVITVLLPLVTAGVAALALRQRPPWRFWAGALVGGALVLAYALQRAQAAGQGFAPQPADAWVVLGVLAASVGYVAGARVTPALGAERVICWVTLLALPVTLPGAWWAWPAQPLAAVAPSAWAGFAYVSLFSMWIGFFAWYRALDWGGAVRISQLQLLQPFFAMLAAWPLRGEPVAAASLGFAAAVVATVVWSRRAGGQSPS